MSQLTKKAIREAFLRQINKMPFDKITVKSIAEDCGINRNTFYYHYQDIYQLLDDIFMVETKKVLEGNLDYDTWQEGFLQAASFALENRKGIYHIYNSVNRSKIEKYLNNVAEKIMRDFVEKQTKGMNINAEDIQLVVSFYQCALSGMVLQWLDGGMKQDPEYIIHRLGYLLDGTIKHMLQRADKK